MIYKILVFLLSFSWVFSQNQFPKLSEAAEISILTFGSGKHLNDAFGHTGIRVKDSVTNLDIIFNYGVYDFDTPNFYTKFAQGRLNYKMGANYTSSLLDYYKRQNRSIEEQVLNFNFNENLRLYNYLLNNYKPQNRYYLYDFFYDNCATRIKDVCNEALNYNIKYIIPEGVTNASFRTYIHEQVNWNSWGRLGIDLALGAKIDQPTTPEKAMFLPKYIHEFFRVAKVNDKPLVKEESTLFKPAPSQNTAAIIFWSPLFVLSCMSIMIIWLTWKDFKHQKRSQWIDITLFLITGTVGVILLLLWFATNHKTTANNYNLLWGFPLNLLIIPSLLKSKLSRWTVNYIKLLLICIALLCVHWMSGVQNFPVVIIPFLIALTLRYIYLIKN